MLEFLRGLFVGSRGALLEPRPGISGRLRSACLIAADRGRGFRDRQVDKTGSASCDARLCKRVGARVVESAAKVLSRWGEVPLAVCAGRIGHLRMCHADDGAR